MGVKATFILDEEIVEKGRALVKENREISIHHQVMKSGSQRYSLFGRKLPSRWLAEGAEKKGLRSTRIRSSLRLLTLRRPPCFAFHQYVNHRWVGQCARVTKILCIRRGNLGQYSPHYFAAPGLW